jgi:Tol biopolymer transport system component
MRFQIHAPAGARLPLGTPAVSPDGRTIAYAQIDADGTARIQLRPIDRVESRALPGTEGVSHLFWSPDGRSLAFMAGRQLKRIDIAGGSPRDLAPVYGQWHGSWSARGDILFLAEKGLSRVSANGGASTPVGPGTFPAFLSDGERFLFRDHAGSIHLGRLGSTEHEAVTADVASAPIIAATPGGRTFILYLRDRDLVAQEFDDRAGRVGGRETVAVSGIAAVANPAIRPAVGVSASGTLAYQAAQSTVGGALTWFDRTGTVLERLPDELFVEMPDLSPDGSSVVGARIAAFREIHVVDLGRRLRRRVPVDVRYAIGVRWSPNGQRLAVGQQGDRTILLVDPVTGEATPLNESGSAGAWLPDGRSFLSSLGPGSRWRVISVDGAGKATEMGPRTAAYGQSDVSADGRYAAFTITENGRSEVYVQSMTSPTSFARVSVNGGTYPHWGRTSAELFFVSPDGAIMEAAVRPDSTVPAAAPRELFRPGGGLVSFDVSADGQRFLVSSVPIAAGDVPITVVLNWWREITGQE